ncbi:DUF3025 domain-containing protein [Planctobacterium marinum]|uniref:Transmembrane protein n=1 Tax=Planctobacterium marinum TaxID=1631968 RepID=A0AA48KRD7_9ALTE|nr:hypothetical protein MACH26_29790 [Planctobacterium marinum]
MQHSPKRFKTPENWYTDWLSQPYFVHVKTLFDLYGFGDFPTTKYLNQWIQERGITDIEFVCDEAIQGGQYAEQTAGLYYEEIIARCNFVPTRKNNWHDLFNALIWLLFPKSKKALNQLHMAEIKEHGLNPRTAVRNRVTHFDECGAVLVFADEAHLEALQGHRWVEAFVDCKNLWQQNTQLFMFGHANYEMLLDPYLGLTGKYVAIKVEPEFYQLPLLQQYAWLDDKLLELIEQGALFEQKAVLKPLPLLGIPGWDAANEDPEYYANQDYFRPLRKTIK